MTLLIRRGTETDPPIIRTLAERIWRDSYSAIISAAQISYMLNWMYAPHKLLSEIRRGVVYELVEADGQPIGYLAWELMPDATAHLHKLYLAREYQGHGFGQQLLRHVQRSALKAGAVRLELRVNKANNRARIAYERAGLTITDRLVTDIGGGFVMDDFVMSKPLTDLPAPTQFDTSGLPSV
jgi:ribosomal protein S18 acetylase RimI-like enzyme